MITVVLLTIGLVAVAMGMLGIGVLLDSRQPLKGSCRTVGNSGAGSCDTCQCHHPPPGS